MKEEVDEYSIIPERIPVFKERGRRLTIDASDLSKEELDDLVASIIEGGGKLEGD
tara:strand:- start:950 stop:1114 length:165 start_codon:yes stop_codon:yes gene_type:complete